MASNHSNYVLEGNRCAPQTRALTSNQKFLTLNANTYSLFYTFGRECVYPCTSRLDEVSKKMQVENEISHVNQEDECACKSGATCYSSCSTCGL